MSIRELSETDALSIWKELYGTHLSIYMNPSLMEIYMETYRWGRRRWNKKKHFYLVTTKKGYKVLAPLIVGRGEAYIMGDLSATGSLDLIYNEEINCEEFGEVITEIKTELGLGCKLYFNKLLPNSLLRKYLEKNYHPKYVMPCVNVKLGSEYQDYFQALSKHVRQNYRTAMNRLKREGKNLKLLYDAKSPSLHKMEMNIYTRRAQSWGINYSVIHKYFFDKVNPISRMLEKADEAIHVCLLIENELAAFFCGFSSDDKKKIVVPRLAINDKYKKYSPGTLLIGMAVKEMIRNGYENLDMSRGDEKYKYALGGESYEIMNFTL